MVNGMGILMDSQKRQSILKRVFHTIFRIVVIGGGMWITGCAISSPSEESRFYSLSSPEIPHQNFDQIRTKGQAIAVGPVYFPDHLKRASVVVIKEDNQYQIAKLDQWGGSLENEFETALVKNLLAMNPGKAFVLDSGMLSQRDDMQLKMDIYRFGATENGQVRLEASWGWVGHSGKLLSAGTFSESIKSGDVLKAQVAAMSHLVAMFAEEVSGTLP